MLLWHTLYSAFCTNLTGRENNLEQVRAKKHLGQHFLTDLGIARDIAEAVSADAGAGACSVLEIGPGMGMLTQFLIPRADLKLEVAEIDVESVVYLHEHYPDLTVIEGDFLEMDLKARYGLVADGGGVVIAGNFPYNISSQIFFKVLDNLDIVRGVVCMLQREVAVRIAQGPGTKDYGILSVFLQAYFDVEYLFTVDETVFNPPPKVKSGVIRLRRNEVTDLGCDPVLFRKVVKGIFNQRRKTVRNSLRASCSEAFVSKGDSGGDVVPFGDLRPERLSVADFVEITRWVAERM